MNKKSLYLRPFTMYIMNRIMGIKTSALAAALLMGTVALGQNLQQAIQLTKDEQFEKADKAFKALINAKPSEGNIYFYEGENFFSWGKLDSAENAYQKGIKMNPANALNYAGLGKIKLGEGNTDAANTNFYQAKTITKSKDAIVLSKIAEAYTVAPKPFQDLKTAIDLLNQALKIDSKNPDIYIDLGDAQWAADPTNASNAITAYDKALSIDPKNVIAYLREGMVYQNAANYGLSLGKYQNAIAIDSTFAPAYRQKAEMYYNSGLNDAAVEQYKKYLALNDALSARIRYAKFLFLAKKYDDAITEIQKVLPRDSSDIVLFRILAYSQFEKKDYKNGLTSITKFFAKQPSNPGVKLITSDYVYYGKLLSQNHQDSLAISKLNQAAAMLIASGDANGASDLYNQVGNIYYSDENYLQAMVYFQKRIQVNQSDVNAYYYLGKAAYNCKNYQAADSAFSTVIAKRPELMQGYQWKAYSEEAIDSLCETGLAIQACNQYLQKLGADSMKYKDDYINCCTYLGLCRVTQKDMEGAAPWFKRILNIDPDNEKAKKFFKSLKQEEGQKKEGKK